METEKAFLSNKQITLLVILVTCIIMSFFVLDKINKQRNLVKNEGTQTEIVFEEQEQPEGLPTFSWKLDYTDETEYPETTLFLTATYENGVANTKEVDTAQGSCNTYDNPKNEEVYKNSEMIICYYAGLGHYYKILQSENKFLVQRRVFEEGSPEYTPVVLPFETIKTF